MTYDTFGEKFANVNEFYNNKIHQSMEQNYSKVRYLVESEELSLQLLPSFALSRFFHEMKPTKHVLHLLHLRHFEFYVTINTHHG